MADEHCKREIYKEVRKMEIEDQLRSYRKNFDELLETIKDLPFDKQKIIMSFVEMDRLTGALVKEKCFRDLGEMIAMANRNVMDGLSILMLDIDDFKYVNDTHGHPAGDEVLREFATQVKCELREYDELYRFGGDEFTVTLPGTSLEGGVAVAERIRRQVENHSFPHCGREGVTTSIGVAYQEGNKLRNVETMQAMIIQADQALYDAKDRGKNRVVAQEAIEEDDYVKAELAPRQEE